ncbi:MAG: diacylglycerol kinase family lipid kinase [Clostridia bacterium]|nr:diacylglycerol kinase family lipid kinase [Clostridia bacterium]
MRYVFIINPKAGKKNPYKKVFPRLKKICEENGLNYSCHLTKGTGHATELARMEAEKGDSVRIFACGGDGTLTETANGIIGFDNAELGAIPCGSGNDYIKSFEGVDFSDYMSNILGTAKKVDAIKVNDKYALNICSLGVDAMVAYRMVMFKRWPLVSGHMAYTLALLVTVLGKISTKFDIEIDGQPTYSGKTTLALGASGKCYGGGYWGAKKAVVDDGLLDCVILKKIPKIKLAGLLAKYKVGEHFDDPAFKKILIYKHGKTMTLKCKKPTVLNFDGECVKTDRVDLELVPSALNFVVPSAK